MEFVKIRSFEEFDNYLKVDFLIPNGRIVYFLIV